MPSADHNDNHAGDDHYTIPNDGNIDMNTFEQVLEMDDDEDEREFSKSIVYDFFGQAESTFEKMDTELQDGNLEALSAQGHFLKGSSATLGLNKVRDSCEKIQHFGACKDETGTYPLEDRDVCIENIRKVLKEARVQFRDAERILKRFYNDEGES